ncbi:MAG: lipid-A-disaccharide synthase [Bacteroidota bacterium]|jgi:lipid-A-disaccharide synthase
MKLYIIAGEASGDLHGSNLAKELMNVDPTIEMRGWGGELMESNGVTIVKHYRDLAFMGFVEVILNLRTIAKNFHFCKEDIVKYSPDAVVLIDYPGFNLRIAAWCKKHSIPVFYYISPQIWAWKQGRVKNIKRDVTRMFTILPFEKEFYARFDVEVEFVGHPLLDIIPENNYIDSIPNTNPLIALLPGSRKQEIRTMLPLMLEEVRDLGCDYIIAGAPGQDLSFYTSIEGVEANKIVFGRTYEIFQKAHAGMVTSGTATLEAALFGLPQVVCYKGSRISYNIAKKLIKIKYISLVNLIMNSPVVVELIQDSFNKENLHHELKKLISDGKYRQEIRTSYSQLRAQLGGPGASERTAKLMLTTLSELIQYKK